MTRDLSLLFVIVASMMATIWAECPNACSAHGKCGAYDMCTCYRNWMAADCSERICQFGMAHVDIPKGDLDGSGGALSGASTNVVVNDFIYPYGTTELYASQMNIDGEILENTAHEYRECSAQGICDRSTGTCSCFEGYEGSACQRASCPSSGGLTCSGHGTCHTIKELSEFDSHNVYKLWDEQTTLGCKCDAGYSGPDCSQRECKVGVDPLYFDNNATLRYSNWTYAITTTASTTVTGNYSFIFYDAYGNDWHTAPIDIAATCDTLTNAIEALPNNAVPAGSVRCWKDTISVGAALSGSWNEVVDSNIFVHVKYTLAFTGNPGKLRQPKLDLHLDGSRATLQSTETHQTVNYFIYPNGFSGEEVDYVNQRCAGVTVNILSAAGPPLYYYIDGMTSAQHRLLKTCLGDANGVESDNTEVYNWDYGDNNNPHLIKLQDATQYQLPQIFDTDGDEEVDWATYILPKTQLCTSIAGNQARFGVAGGVGYCADNNRPGFYAVVTYVNVGGGVYRFKLMTNPGKDFSSTTPFYVYTTTGYLQVVSNDAKVFSTISTWTTSATYNAVQAQTHSNLLFMANSTSTYTNYFGDLSCENYDPLNKRGMLDCINKNDLVMILNPTTITDNPRYPNIYQVTKISNEEKTYHTDFPYPNPTDEENRLRLTLDMSLNTRYVWAESASSPDAARVFKFYPKNPTVAATHANYGGTRYVGPCSMRGNCNQENGLCECYNGFTTDNCGVLNALAQ